MNEFLSLSSEPLSETCRNEPAMYAGFWRRLAAFLIDGLALGIFGLCIGSVFFDELAHLGVWGKLVGFTIALAYFGVLNSSIGGGQTLGKRILNIKVVDSDGSPISIHRSTIRFAIIGIPYFLNGAMIPTSNVLIQLLAGVTIFGTAFAIVYLFIFNRRTRQSLHDLAAESFVVRGTDVEPPQREKFWQYHLLISSIGAVVIFVVGLLSSLFVANTFQLQGLTVAQERLLNSDKYHYASVFSGTSFGPSGQFDFVRIVAVSNQNPESYEAAAIDVAKIVLESVPEIENKAALVITITYGFDIGIASAWQNGSYNHSPQEWAEILQNSAAHENED